MISDSGFSLVANNSCGMHHEHVQVVYHCTSIKYMYQCFSLLLVSLGKLVDKSKAVDKNMLCKHHYSDMYRPHLIKIQKICSAHTCIHLAGCSRRESRNTGASPFSFTISVLGSSMFIAQYTGPYSFTSHPKDEAIMVKCLAQGHKRRDRAGRDSNPHSINTRTRVQCTRLLGHDTPLSRFLSAGNWNNI